MRSRARVTDEVRAVATSRRDAVSGLSLVGHGEAELFGPDGETLQVVRFKNLVTEVGDQFYGERAHGLGSLGPVQGMKLGDDATAPTKTGAAAHLGNYIAGSQKVLDATYPQSALEGTARRITFVTTWDPGEATASGIAEVIITLQDPLADNAGVVGDTIARGLLTPTINKGANDTLVVTWHHDLEGA